MLSQLMLEVGCNVEVRVKEPYKEPVTGKSGVGAEEHGMNTVHPEASEFSRKPQQSWQPASEDALLTLPKYHRRSVCHVLMLPHWLKAARIPMQGS